MSVPNRFDLEPSRSTMADSMGRGISVDRVSAVAEAPRVTSGETPLRILVPTESFGFSITTDVYKGDEVLIIEISRKL